jgi:hypothetical protein
VAHVGGNSIESRSAPVRRKPSGAADRGRTAHTLAFVSGGGALVALGVGSCVDRADGSRPAPTICDIVPMALGVGPTKPGPARIKKREPYRG